MPTVPRRRAVRARRAPRSRASTPRRPLRLLAGLTLALAPALAACADPSAPAVTPPGAPRAAALAAGGPGEVVPGRYIVVFRDSVRDAPGLARRLAAGGQLRATYTAAVRGFAAALPEQAAEALRRDPRVASVEADQRVRADDVVEATALAWGLDRIDQPALPLDARYAYESDGRGANVYIIDSGIRTTNVEFGGRAVAAFTAIGDGNGTNDCYGHGTHVAGIAGGATYGVAKAARLYAVRVLDCGGNGTVSELLAGVDWVTRNRVLPAVANLSLGGAYSSTLNQAVRSSIASGVVYTVSAGNYAKDACTLSPASVPEAVTVGAVTQFDTQASFSDYGSCVDLYAPGVSILSAYIGSDTDTYYLSGTSMAAPFAAGAAALYLSGNPTASPAAVSQALADNATRGALTQLGAGSPNRLLYTRFGVAATAPEPSPEPSPEPMPAPPLTGTSVDRPPTASFTASCGRRGCTFNGGSSTDDRGIVAYAWTFGDGSPVVTGTAGAIAYAYAAKGSYLVTLTVTDAAGQTATATSKVTVRRV